VADEITLTVPRERPFYRVAHLVLGGLAVRLDLTFDTLEDLQIALAGLLSREHEGDGSLTMSLRVLPDALQASIGPFEDSALRDEWDSDQELSLRRILATVVDHAEIAHRDGAQWVELTKNVARAA
jgi:hypothetical protein